MREHDEERPLTGELHVCEHGSFLTRTTCPQCQTPPVVHDIPPALLKILEERAANPPGPLVRVGPREYVTLRGEPAVMVRQDLADGGRVTDFIHLEVSPGLDAIDMARKIAAALSCAEHFRAPEGR